MKRIFDNRGFLFSIFLGVLSILSFGFYYFLIRIELVLTSLSPDSAFNVNYLADDWMFYLSPTAKYVLYLPLVLAILFFSIGIYLLYKNRKSEKH